MIDKRSLRLGKLAIILQWLYFTAIGDVWRVSNTILTIYCKNKKVMKFEERIWLLIYDIC